MAIAIDYETYYDERAGDPCTVKILGNWHYVRHPRFDAYMVSIIGEGIKYTGGIENAPWAKLDRKNLIAHNASFEQAITERLVEIGKIPAIQPARWDCTLDLGAYFGGCRSLKDCAKFLLDREITKDIRERMKGKTWASLPEEKKKDLLEYACLDSELSLELWDTYSPHWSDMERWVAKENRDTGAYGVAVDVPGIAHDIDLMKESIRVALNKIPWSGEVNEEGKAIVLSHKKVAEQCRKEGIACPVSLAEDSPECEAWENQYGAKHEFVSALRTFRKSNTVLKKLQVMQQRTRPDGVMGFDKKYFGATTGRFSGAGKFNMENLPREPYLGVDLRRRLIARPGKTFVLADFSQIEPRCLNFLAGNWELLRRIREGLGIYEAFAVTSKLWEAGTPGFKKCAHYQMCKAAVLGAGYGMSAAKFVLSAPILTGGQYNPTLSEADAAITLFRKTNPLIVKFWDRVMRNVKLSRLGNCDFDLPSGRTLTYYEVQSLGGWSVKKTKASARSKVWHGLVTENITQAMARDVLVHAWKNLVDRGFKVLFSVHDELIVEVDEATAERDQVEIEKIMTQQIPWAKALPLAVESQISSFYRK